mmetsp:Transcript_54529/g.62502  ORF Transcript_54529/g.62502 Transcript_54529/m.62502 type:complete len:245 (-) Transcript_54529:369-1103(-)
MGNTSTSPNTKAIKVEPQGRPQESVTKPLTDKRIVLIRHGQSEYNKWRSKTYSKMSFFCESVPSRLRDAPLSDKGKAQCRQLNSHLGKMNVFGESTLVVSSPLCRALQTATLACEGYEDAVSRFVVSPLISERVHTYCDIGSTVKEMETRFSEFDFSLVEDQWWVHSKYGSENDVFEPIKESDTQVFNRVKLFYQWLQQQPEDVIVLVSHGNFFRCLFGHWFAKMKNCECREVSHQKVERWISK